MYFSYTPKVSRLFRRAVSAESTAASLTNILRKVPVTRIADLTLLDPLRLPVFCAVTPLARDLTTHLGKGPDACAARVSALMEAIERVSAETYYGPVKTSSLRAMHNVREQVIDPRTCDLPDDSIFTPDTPIAWVKGWNLLADGEVWIPRDLVINPPQEGVLCDPDTNGLAAGNTLLEAVVHALCEVIERDAVGQVLFARLFGDAGDAAAHRRLVHPATLPTCLNPWLDRIASHRLSMTIAEIKQEFGLTTFEATLTDDAFPSGGGLRPRSFTGYGADPCAEAAILRSVTEAVQSRLAYVQGARDTFNRIPIGSRQVAWIEGLRSFDPALAVSFNAAATFESNDMLEELYHVLDRLSAAGFRSAVVVELTRPDLGIPVVRVRVPGLTSFLVNQRRVGWRCLRHLL